MKTSKLKHNKKRNTAFLYESLITELTKTIVRKQPQRKQKVLKAKKLTTFNKKNLNDWMNLTKKERYKLTKQDSLNYMDKRKLLLEEMYVLVKHLAMENPFYYMMPLRLVLKII